MKSSSERIEYATLTEGARVIKRPLWNQGRTRRGIVVGASVCQGKNFFYPVKWDGSNRVDLVMRQRLVLAE